MIIYTLELEHGKFYVGRTNRTIECRFAEHMAGKGSLWTREHKPKRVITFFETDNPYDENRTVYEMMEKHGISAVRGGIFLSIKLSAADQKHIRKEIAGARDECFICHSCEHFAASCGLSDIELEPRVFDNPSMPRISVLKAIDISKKTGVYMPDIVARHNGTQR